MTSLFDQRGAKIPVTVLQIENCQVTATVETPRPEPLPTYYAVQLAASDKAAKNTTAGMLGHFKKAGVAPKRIVKEFPVTKDALVPVGMWSTPANPVHGLSFRVTRLAQAPNCQLCILYLASTWMWCPHRESRPPSLRRTRY